MVKMAGQGTSLKAYALTRLALVLPMVLILLTFVFLLMRVAPGDPISASLGGHAPQSVIDEIKHRLGFDKPIYVQYGNYLWDTLRGNFGSTITDQRPVSDIILTNGAATLELTFFAMIVAIIVGVLVGLVAGRYRDTPLDVGGRLFGIVIYATPVFFLGLMAQLFFGSFLGWLPTSDRASPITQATLQTHTNILTIDAIIDGNGGALADVVKHLVLPSVTLGLHPPDPGQRDPHAQGRLHRGGAGAWHQGALRHLPARLQERPRSGDHRRGLDARGIAGRRGAHRDYVQLAGYRAPACPVPGKP
jgi:peptide/nickel transport system permease protein